MKKLWLGGVAVCLLSACSPSQISKSDVQKALDASKTLNQICVPFQLTIDTRLKENDEITQELLGAREVRFLKRRPDGKHANHAAAEQMEALVDAGIYSSAESKRIGEGEETVRYYSYQLTPKGENYFVPSPHGALLCVGQQKVTDIRYYTEPTPANGITVSQVAYQADIQMPSWAKTLLRDTPMYEDLKQPLNEKITLVKTNGGWRDIRQIRRDLY